MRGVRFGIAAYSQAACACRSAMYDENMRDRLGQIAFAVRDFLEPRWGEWHAVDGGVPFQQLSRNTCGRSSTFLVRAIHHEGIPAELKTGVPRFSEDGPELGPYGFLANARWEAHSWVVASKFIIDITADQFGASAVIVTPMADERYGEGPVDPATPYYKERRQKLVEEIWPAWTEYRVHSDRAFTGR